MPMKQLVIPILALLMLCACTNTNETREPVSPPKNQVSQEPVGDEQLPETKELEVTVEGMTERVPAVLTKSELGYAIYVLEGFEFTPEEPSRDMVFHQNFPDYFMRIEVLPDQTDAGELRQNSEETLRAVGAEVADRKNDFFDPTLRTNADFILQTVAEDSTVEIIGLQIEDRWFRFTLFLPHVEAAEGVSPRFYPMINSIVLIE